MTIETAEGILLSLDFWVQWGLWCVVFGFALALVEKARPIGCDWRAGR